MHTWRALIRQFGDPENRISDYVRRTSLDRYDQDGDRQPVFLKREDKQYGGSFKYRGALNAVLSNPRKNYVGYSSGNHAIALALASKVVNARVYTVVPSDLCTKKRILLEESGAEVIYLNDFQDNKAEVANRISQEVNGLLVPPAGDMQVILGQSTAVQDAICQYRDETGVLPSRLFVPTGGGGLLAGAVIAVRRNQASINIIPVRPQGWCTDKLLHTKSTLRTSCDALRVSQTSPLVSEICDAHVSHWVPVCEREIDEAEIDLWNRASMKVERSAAIAFAAWQKELAGGVNGDVVFVTGGNF